jgi:hypothetical protein
MSILLLFVVSVAPTDYQEAQTQFYGSATGKYVLRDVFPTTNLGNSVFASKADLRDTFAGTLDQTESKVGAVRGYGTKRNNL